MRNMDLQTDGLGDFYIPTKSLFARGGGGGGIIYEAHDFRYNVLRCYII